MDRCGMAATASMPEMRAAMPALRCDRAFSGLSHRCQIQKRVSIFVREILKQARHLGLIDRAFDIVAQPHQRHNLAFADKLLRQVRLEQLNLARQRSRQVGLLHKLCVDELFLAQLQHLAVIEQNRHRADEQHRAEHEPQDADAAGAQALPSGCGQSRHMPAISLEIRDTRISRTEVQAMRMCNWTGRTRVERKRSGVLAKAL